MAHVIWRMYLQSILQAEVSQRDPAIQSHPGNTTAITACRKKKEKKKRDFLLEYPGQSPSFPKVTSSNLLLLFWSENICKTTFLGRGNIFYQKKIALEEALGLQDWSCMSGESSSIFPALTLGLIKDANSIYKPVQWKKHELFNKYPVWARQGPAEQHDTEISAFTRQNLSSVSYHSRPPPHLVPPHILHKTLLFWLALHTQHWGC